MLFVDRDEELSWLLKLFEAKKKGGNFNALIYGLRRVGKTFLLKKFVSLVSGYYVNLSYITSGEELLRFVSNMGIGVPKVGGLDALKEFFMAFQRLSEERGEVIAVALDEFHVMVESLSQSFGGGKVAEKIFWYLKSLVEDTDKVFWVFSTSLSWHLIERGRSPARKAFLALFSTRKIDPFDRKSSIQLVNSLANLFGVKIGLGDAERIYELSGGIPALINMLVERFATSGKSLDEVVEDFAKSNELSDFFEALIGFVLEVIPYSKTTVLKVLKYLAQGYSSASEIAEVEGISYNTVYNLLESLVSTEIVKKVAYGREVSYHIAYPLMKPWLLTLAPEPKLFEKRLRYSLGIAVESYIKELLERIGKLDKPLEIPDNKGVLTAGTWDRIRILPIVKVERPRGPPEAQVDFLAKGVVGRSEEVYLIEAKYTYAPIDRDEVEKFVERVNFLKEKVRGRVVPIIIQGGEGGILPEAAVFAAKHGVKIITKIGLEKIVKRLDMAPI